MKNLTLEEEANLYIFDYKVKTIEKFYKKHWDFIHNSIVDIPEFLKPERLQYKQMFKSFIENIIRAKAFETVYKLSEKEKEKNDNKIQMD